MGSLALLVALVALVALLRLAQLRRMEAEAIRPLTETQWLARCYRRAP